MWGMLHQFHPSYGLSPELDDPVLSYVKPKTPIPLNVSVRLSNGEGAGGYHCSEMGLFGMPSLRIDDLSNSLVSRRKMVMKNAAEEKIE